MKTWERFERFLLGKEPPYVARARQAAVGVTLVVAVLAVVGVCLYWAVLLSVNSGGSFGLRFLIEPENRAANFVLPWPMMIVFVFSGRLFAGFVATGDRGAGLWLWKWLKTAKHGRFAPTFTYFKAKIYFAACSKAWVKADPLNAVSANLWNACFVERGDFFPADLIVDDCYLCLFRKWLNSLPKQKESHARVFGLVVLVLFVSAYFAVCPILMNVAYSSLWSANVWGGGLAGAFSGSYFAFAAIFAGVACFLSLASKRMMCPEQELLRNWFTPDGAVLALPDAAAINGLYDVAQNNLHFFRKTPRTGPVISLVWAYKRWHKQAGLGKIKAWQVAPQLLWCFSVQVNGCIPSGVVPPYSKREDPDFAG